MKIRRNILLFKLNCFFAELWPLSALAIVYFEQITGSYATALGVFSIANIIQSLAEIPTGVLSDRLGRKYTLSASALIFLLSFTAFASAGNFNMPGLLITGGILWGIAEAFNSGTDEALIYETMEQLRKSDKYDIIFSQSKMFAQIGLGCGALVATAVTYFYSLNALAWTALIPALGQFIVTLFLVEPETKFKGQETSSLRHCIQAFKKIKDNHKLQLLALLQICNKGGSYAAHRLEGAYFDTLIPTFAVNLTRVIKQSTGAISFYAVKYVHQFSLFQILVASMAGNVVVRAAGLLLNNGATPYLISLVNLFYGTEATSQSTLLQKELSKNERATMGSMVGMAGGIITAGVYYLAGWLADLFSLYAVMWGLIGFKAILGSAYSAMLKKYRQ